MNNFGKPARNNFILIALVTFGFMTASRSEEQPLTREVISPPSATTRAPLPISPGVRVGEIIYVSGQVELDAPDITSQTTSVLKKVQAVVEAAGASMAKGGQVHGVPHAPIGFCADERGVAHVLSERPPGAHDGDRRGARAGRVSDRDRVRGAPLGCLDTVFASTGADDAEVRLGSEDVC